MEKIKYIISRISDNLINVFRLDSEEGGSDIELTILRAFLNCNFSRYCIALFLDLKKNLFLQLEKINTTKILN